MAQTQLKVLLGSLIANWENEVVEFKAVGDSYSTSNIGKYLSALSNKANLRNVDRAWLVFGVNNETRSIQDSDYRRDRERLDELRKSEKIKNTGTRGEPCWQLDRPDEPSV